MFHCVVVGGVGVGDGIVVVVVVVGGSGGGRVALRSLATAP